METFKTFITSAATIVVVGVVITVIVYFRMWQCEELFPNASLLACVFWH